MISPFLTDLDANAVIKGSRDPLSIQPIWTRFGRHVVGNLTTVSTSVRDFTTLLLGYYFAEILAQEQGADSELATFLKWEQLAAYARSSVNEDTSFRGTERVAKKLSNVRPKVAISADRAQQILSNQKTYGLWGLFSVPARSSGLIDGDPPRLSVRAKEFIEKQNLSKMNIVWGGAVKKIIEMLAKNKFTIDVNGADAKVLSVIAQMLKWEFSTPEREFYRKHLLHGGHQDQTKGLQQKFALLLDKTLSMDEFEWSPQAVDALAKEAHKQGAEWQPLAERLERIRTCESVMAPMAALFSHLLGFDRPKAELVQRLKSEWGDGLSTINMDEVRTLRAELANGSDEIGDRWIAIAEKAVNGAYDELLDLLIQQNGRVMDSRGGAPWAEIRNGHIHIRMRDESGKLPTKTELPSLWKHQYFLDALRVVAKTLKEH